MSGKENIIARILQDAEEEKTEILRAAAESVAEIERADEEYCAALRAEAERRMAEEKISVVERCVSAANMDVKKGVLKAKREQISAVFQIAEERILSLGQAEYNRFLIGLIEKNAEEGDTVVFSEKESARAAEAIEYAVKRGYATRTDGKFSGGLILEGKTYDKNMTLSMLLREYRESHEGEIADLLKE